MTESGESSTMPSVTPPGYPAPKSNLLRSAVLVLLALIGMAGAFAVGRHSRSHGILAESNQEHSARLKVERERAALEASETQIKEKKAADLLAKREKIASAQHDLQRLLDEASGLKRLAGTAETEMALWQQRSEALMTDNAGKAIAASQTYLNAFITLQAEKRLGQPEIDAARSRVQILMKPLEEALTLEDPSVYTPSDSLKGQLSQENATLSAISDSYHQARAKAEAMADAAAKRGEKSPVTLQDAIANLKRDLAAQQAKAIADAEAEARAKVNADLARARAEKLQAEGKAKVAQLNAETTATNVATEIKTRESKEASEKERRTQLAQSEQVKTLLAPFLAEGYFQPRFAKNSILRVEKRTEKTPMSLSALKSVGALEPDKEGIKALWTIVNGRHPSPNPDPDRPHWGMPPLFDKLTGEQLEQIKKCQGYLIDLGDTMVELKMLAP